MEELLDIRRVLRKERTERGVAAGLSEGKLRGAHALSQRPCGLCGTNQSKYICPHCNVPYCSQACYADPGHAKCAGHFAERALGQARSLAAEERRTQNNANMATTVPIGPDRVAEQDEHRTRAADQDQERARMMAILHRLEEFDLDNPGSALDEKTELDKDLSEKDLDSLTAEELMSLLEPEEVNEFKNFINDPRQRALIGDLPFAVNTSQAIPTQPEPPQTRSQMNYADFGARDDTPWWALESNLRPHESASQLRLRRAHDTDNYERSLEQLTQAMVQRAKGAKLAQIRGDEPVTSAPNPADLRFNVCAMVLAYSFVVRQMALPCLSHLPKSSRQAMFDVLYRLIPFLSPPAARCTQQGYPGSANLQARPAPEIILRSVEQACQFFLSRLTACEQGAQPTQLLQQALGDAQVILTRLYIQEVRPTQPTENVSNVEVDTAMLELHSSPAPAPSPPTDAEVAKARMASYSCLVSMGYDLYLLFGAFPAPESHCQAMSGTARPRHSKRSKPGVGELMQRKLIYYLASYLSVDASERETVSTFPALAGRRKPRTVMGQLQAQLTALETEAQRTEFEDDLRATQRFQQNGGTPDIVLLATGSETSKPAHITRARASRDTSRPLIQEMDPTPSEPVAPELTAESDGPAALPSHSESSSHAASPATSSPHDSSGQPAPATAEPAPDAVPPRPTSFAALKAHRARGATNLKIARAHVP